MELLQTFYPLVARAELPEDAMPLEFMQDRRLDFVDYSKLKPFTVSIRYSVDFFIDFHFRTSSRNANLISKISRGLYALSMGRV